MFFSPCLRRPPAATLLCIATSCTFGQIPDQNVGVSLQTPDLVNVKIVQRLGERVPLNAEFLDQLGHPVRFGDALRQRPVVVLPIFYECKGVCNLELRNLLSVLPLIKGRVVGREFDVVVLGINPTEGPELAKGKLDSVLASSTALAGTAEGWHFLTGKLDQIKSVTDALGFYYSYDSKKNVVNHPSGIMFLTPNGIISSYLLGANYTPEAVSKNLDVAAEFKLGNKTEDVFFGCVHIDPITGQKSLVVVQALKIGGILTLGAIVMTLVAWSRHRASTVDA